jgi:hypothetical protein
MGIVSVGIALACLVQPALADDAPGKYAGSYLCIEDMAAGLMWDAKAKHWTSVLFNPNYRFVLTATYHGTLNYLETYDLSTTEVGTSNRYQCHGDVPATAGTSETVVILGDAQCSGVGEHFDINFDTLRFTRAFQFGYTSGVDNSDNTPSINGGLCTKITTN